MKLKVETVGSIISQWGEAPIWWKDALYYVDIAGKKIHRFHPETLEEKSWDLDQRIGTIVPCEDGSFLIGCDDGIYRFQESDGSMEFIVNPEPDKPDNRFNDGKCSPDGRFFAGTISLVRKTGDAKLYRLDADLTLHEAFSPVTTSNGIVWTADGLGVYYIDTPTRQVLRFDYDVISGALNNPRVAFSTAFIDASPDGMAIDENNHLWIAFCHAGCVICFNPEDGAVLERIDFPCIETTACAFGGKERKDLYVTTGIHSTLEEPDAGRLFVIRNLPVQGQAAYPFKNAH